MGVYSVQTESSVNLENTGIIECNFENMTEAALNIIAESEYNYGEIMKHIGISELAAFEESGAEMVYEAEQANGFVEKIKAFFMGIWEKIKGLFKKFFAMLDVYSKTDKEFATKYKKELYSISHSLTDFKYKGFKFSISSSNNSIDAVDKKLNGGPSTKDLRDMTGPHAIDVEAMKKIIENMEDAVDEMRGDVAGGGTQTASEFNKELFMLFRSGEESKEELDNPNINDMLTQLEGSKEARTTAEKAFKALEKIIKDVLKATDKAKSDLIKTHLPKNADGTSTGVTDMSSGTGKGVSNSDAVMCMGVVYSITKHKMNILQTYNGALLTAMKDEGRQNKAVCAALLSYKPKKEGAEYTQESTFLSGVKLK